MMAHVDPLERSELGEHEAGFEIVEKMMGFVPNSMFTMARVPGLLPAFQAMGRAVLADPIIPRPLAQMCALMSSVGAGCRYCQAHTAHTAERIGVTLEKLDEIWQFETSELFSDAERTALRIAYHSGRQPNAATQQDFDAAGEFWNPDELAAIVAVCSFFGFLNRWNDTMATTLEAGPRAFGETHLSTYGWLGDRHS